MLRDRQLHVYKIIHNNKQSHMKLESINKCAKRADGLELNGNIISRQRTNVIKQICELKIEWEITGIQEEHFKRNSWGRSVNGCDELKDWKTLNRLGEKETETPTHSHLNHEMSIEDLSTSTTF